MSVACRWKVLVCFGSIGNLGNTVLAFAAGTDRRPDRIPAGAGIGGGLLTAALEEHRTGLVCNGYLLLGGYRSARSLIYAQVSPLIHPAQMGLAYGVAETFSALAVMLAPLLAGLLYTQDPGRVYWVSAGLIGAT